MQNKLKLLMLSVLSAGVEIMTVLQFYRKEVERGRSLQRAALLHPNILLLTEHCYNVELSGERGEQGRGWRRV